MSVYSTILLLNSLNAPLVLIERTTKMKLEREKEGLPLFGYIYKQ